MINDGWIKLYRKLMETSWYKKPLTTRLFTHLLLLANHDEHTFYWNKKEIKIKSGQLITGLHSLSKETGISTQSIRSALGTLKLTNTITSKSTNKFTFISICKWKDYQAEITSKSTSELTNKQQTNNKQLTTYKKNKNNNTNFVSIGKSPKSYGDEIINTIIEEFERLYGFKPIDRYPRRVGQNIKQRFIKKAKEMGVDPKEEAIIKGIKAYFSWVGNQKSLENVKNLDILRRNTEVFFSRNK